MTSLDSNSSKCCRVCGDVAIAFNFNGLTCESCKSFFRRNAFRFDELKCYRQNKCVIDKSFRRICSKCRLNKCFHIGMKKNLVSIKTRQKKQLKLIDVLKHKNHFENSNLKIDGLDKSNKFIHEQDINLSHYELNLIHKINQTSSFIFVEEQLLPVKGEAKSFSTACNLPGQYIKKIIRFCKSNSQFSGLNIEDQLVIIKPYFTEMLLIRFAFVFSVKQNVFILIEDESAQHAVYFKIDLMKEAKNRKNCKLIFARFFKRALELMENDRFIRNLLMTILMFMPREKISCPEYINYCYQVNVRLLARYLENKYQNVQIALQKYNKLLKLMQKVGEIRETISGFFTQFEIHDVMDVLTEIYDLKQ